MNPGPDDAYKSPEAPLAAQEQLPSWGPGTRLEVSTGTVLLLALFSFVLVFLAFLASQLLLILNLPFGLMISSLLIFGAAGLFFPAAFNLRPLAFTGLHRTPLRFIALGVLISAVNLPLADVLMGVAKELLPASWSSVADDTTRMLAEATSTTRLLLVIAAGVAAPLGEELFFRGWLQNLLAQRFRWLASTVVVAIIFSATHLDPIGFIARIELGVLFGLARAWTGSLWPGIAMHATHNLLSTAAFYLSSPNPMAEINEPFDWKSASYGALVSLVLTLVFITVFRRLLTTVPRTEADRPVPFRVTPLPALRILWTDVFLLLCSVLMLATFRHQLPGSRFNKPQPPALTPTQPPKPPHFEDRPHHLK